MMLLLVPRAALPVRPQVIITKTVRRTPPATNPTNVAPGTPLSAQPLTAAATPARGRGRTATHGGSPRRPRPATPPGQARRRRTVPPASTGRYQDWPHEHGSPPPSQSGRTSAPRSARDRPRISRTPDLESGLPY